MTHQESTTKWNRTFINVALYLRILEAKDNQERPIYKVAKKIQSTFYPNGIKVWYL